MMKRGFFSSGIALGCAMFFVACNGDNSESAGSDGRGDGEVQSRVAGKGDNSWLSCKGYCGDYDKTWDCQCDNLCDDYGDCCVDYEEYCGGEESDCPLTGIACLPTCEEGPYSHCEKGVFNSKTCACDPLITVCGGIASLKCNEGYYCDFDATNAQCGKNDMTGVCKVLNPGMACTAQYKPVCGCDDKTYSNSCMAHNHGVSVYSTGKCP